MTTKLMTTSMFRSQTYKSVVQTNQSSTKLFDTQGIIRKNNDRIVLYSYISNVTNIHKIYTGVYGGANLANCRKTLKIWRLSGLVKLLFSAPTARYGPRVPEFYIVFNIVQICHFFKPLYSMKKEHEFPRLSLKP